LSISKIGSRNSLGSKFEGEGPNLLDIAVFSEGTFPPNLEGLKSEEFLAFDANGEGPRA